MSDDPRLLMQHLATMQEALSDHNTSVVAQVTAARQALEACLDLLATRVTALETGMANLVPLMTRLVEYVEQQPKEQPKPKIASYVELYPELRTEAPARPASGIEPSSVPRS